MQPGEAGKIPLKISSKRRSGSVTRAIKVYTNVPGEAGVVTIKMHGEVWQPVQVSPRSASFSRLSADMANRGAVRKLTIVNNVEGMAELTNVRSTNPVFSTDVEVIEPGKKFELTVSLVPPLKTGKNQGRIELTTGISEQPTLSIIASAYVTADVDVMPNRLTLRPGRGVDSNQRFTFKVRNFSRAPLTISDLAVSNPALTVSTAETKPGVDYSIILEVPPDYEVPAGGDKITFKTDCPTMPELTIPIVKGRSIRRGSSSGTTPGNVRRVSQPKAGGKVTASPEKSRGGAGQSSSPGATHDRRPATKETIRKVEPNASKRADQ